MILLKMKQDDINSKPPRRIVLKSGVELFPDQETHRVRAYTEAEAEELEVTGDWVRVGAKPVDSGTLQKLFNVATRRSGFKPIVADGDLPRLAKEAEFRRTSGGQEPPPREQVDMGEVDAGSFGRLRVRHHILHGEISIGGVNSDVDDLDPDLRDAFLRASSEYVDSLEDANLQAPAKAVIGALIAAVLSRHGHVADAVRRMKFKERFGA